MAISGIAIILVCFLGIVLAVMMVAAIYFIITQREK